MGRNLRCFRGWNCLLALLLWFAASPIQAMYWGADPPVRCDGSCAACQGNPLGGGKCSVSEPCTSDTCVSRTEGNLRETYPGVRLRSTSGAPPQLTFTYNSYNADTSRARIDTVLGNGWTHSYNIFLYSVRGAMFRVDGDGRITRYALGPGGTFVADLGYFESLVRNPDGSFTLTQKDKTTYRFAVIPGTPFLPATPVYQLTRITDRNNNTITFTYSSGLLAQTTDTYGRSLFFTYNAKKKLSAITDPQGRSTTFNYDGSGAQLLNITDALGRSVQYSYNFLFQITSKTDKDGRVFAYSYQNNEPMAVTDGAGHRLFAMTNPANWATDSTALAQSMVRQYVPSTTSKTDGRGNPWRYQYDSHGYVFNMTAPDGAAWAYTYDAATLMPASETDPNGRATNYQYDSQGNLIRRTDALGNVTNYTYEPVFNQMTSMTDANGRTTAYTYDANGNRIRETDPLGATRRWTYDSHGNVLTDTDKNGHTTSYTYNAQGNPVQVRDAQGNLTNMTYDSVGNRLARTDANGHTTSYAYDSLDRVVAETDALGKVTHYAYDAQGNRTEVTDRNGNPTKYQYDQRSRVIQVTDSLGQTTKNSYDDNDNRISATDKNGHTTTFAYDVQNRLIKTVDALGNITTAVYDGVGNKLTETDANGHATIYSYDALNRIITRTDAIGSVTRMTYDSTGPCAGCTGPTKGSSVVTKQTDANGKVTYYKYDGLDRQIKLIRKQNDTADTVDGDDAVTTTVYDAVGNRLSLTEPDGNTTTYAYDAINRMVTTTNAVGDTTTMSYDGVGNLVSTTAPTTNITSTVYDALNRTVKVQDAGGIVRLTTYDPVGNVLTRTDGNGNITSYTYDAIYRLTQSTDALGKTTTHAYDAVGNLLSATDRNSNITSYAYDAINRRTSMIDALAHTTQYRYDAVGNLVKLTDANGNATVYAYDGVNRRVTETYADGFSRSYAYDLVGNLTSRTDQNGRTTTYTYSDLYFLARRSYPVSPADNMSYDLSGRMLSAERGGWLVTFTYDGANRVTQTVQNGKTIQYDYNIPARIRNLTYPGGRTITESMDVRGRIAHIDDASPNLVQYTYDAGNRVVSRNYRNGSQAVYSYNGNDWVTSLEDSAGITRVAGFGYSYDNEGNKSFEAKRLDAANSQTRSEAYQYDNIYRLIDYKVGTLSGSTVPVPTTQTQYTLDPLGNWSVKTKDAIPETRTHNAVNEIVTINASPPLGYDNNGNLTEDTRYRYAYDEENRLTAVTRKSDLVLVGQYQYDALSRRVQKFANPAGVPANTRYFYDEARIVEEQDSAAVTRATYVYGNYIDEVLTMNRGGQTYYYHRNALWSVEAITNSAANVVERYSYDAYGLPSITDGTGVPVPPNAWGTPHSAIGNPWMFTGRQLDEETGIYFYRARYYDPIKGRFLQRDPLAYVNGMNLYEYVRGRPGYATDPTGLFEAVPRNCKYCGPDITRHLKNLAQLVEMAYANTTWYNRVAACNFNGFWDIVDLHNRSLSPTCSKRPSCDTPDKETVWMYDRCVYMHEANYFLFGVMNRLCYPYPPGLGKYIGYNWIMAWKAIRYGEQPTEQTFWAFDRGFDTSSRHQEGPVPGNLNRPDGELHCEYCEPFRGGMRWRWAPITGGAFSGY